jgi:hypothetical protein
MLNAWSEPQFTGTLPVGEIEPPEPADATIVYVFSEKLAAIVWLACTFVNV